MAMYAVNGDILSDIADAIRQKRDIADAIPVADMAMQIGLIAGGGGLKFASGDFTLTADSSNVSVSYSLQSKPNLFLVFCDRSQITASTSGFYIASLIGFVNAYGGISIVSRTSSAGSTSLTSNGAASSTVYCVDSSSISVNGVKFYVNNDSRFKFEAGVKYYWYAICIE